MPIPILSRLLKRLTDWLAGTAPEAAASMPGGDPTQLDRPESLDLPILPALSPVVKKRPGQGSIGSKPLAQFLTQLNWQDAPPPPLVASLTLADVLAQAFAPSSAADRPGATVPAAEAATDGDVGLSVVDLFEEWQDVSPIGVGNPLSAARSAAQVGWKRQALPAVARSGVGDRVFSALLAEVVWSPAPPEPVAPAPEPLAAMPRTAATAPVITDVAARYLGGSGGGTRTSSPAAPAPEPAPPRAPEPAPVPAAAESVPSEGATVPPAAAVPAASPAPIAAPAPAAAAMPPPAPPVAAARAAAVQQSAIDLALAAIPANRDIAFNGLRVSAGFEVPTMLATFMHGQANEDGLDNGDVVRPFIDAKDLTRRYTGRSIIDFGVYMAEAQARRYAAPFAHLQQQVGIGDDAKGTWWLHGSSAQKLRIAIDPLPRFLVIPRVPGEPFATWVTAPMLPDHSLVVVASDADWLYAVLNSRAHAVWRRHMDDLAGRKGAYTVTRHFETLPLPPDPAALAARIAEPAAAMAALSLASLDPAPKAVCLAKMLAKPGAEWQRCQDAINAAVLDAYAAPADADDAALLQAMLTLKSSL